jgi:hypothetical protein
MCDIPVVDPHNLTRVEVQFIVECWVSQSFVEPVESVMCPRVDGLSGEMLALFNPISHVPKGELTALMIS